jgi:4-amino-4-deoxy-L-arabinose transferase-like glycosyltransferase
MTKLALALWKAVYVATLLLAAWAAPLQRTQEARVLETGRQMLDQPLRGWLAPTLNGEPRLRKPPLAYWYTAGAFGVFGVNQVSGRLPSMVIMLATLVVTFCFARDAIGGNAGWIAALSLAGSFFFLRFGRLAETDAPAMFAVVLGCCWKNSTW